MKPYYVQNKPFIVPTIDGKLIEEHFGKASIEDGNYSFAHMIAPAGWSEPFQTPEFDEITYVFKGRKKVEIGDETIVLEANQSLSIKKGVRVRYSNPYNEPAEYISFCLPAFTLEGAHREE
jgi:mannose-6-phosphate isomerase-like protein (cupin superfamily)